MMKNKYFFVLSAAAVIVSALLLSTAIVALSLMGTRAYSDNGTLGTPDVGNINTANSPLTRRQMEKKFGVYNTVTEEDGKSVITIFSDEQIKEITARRNSGEWFWITAEEMLFLISDTAEMFAEYDIVYIHGIDGEKHKYYGASFFSSEEYYASFGGTYLGVDDASFDIKQDIYETIYERIKVLNCAVIENTYISTTFVLSDINRSLTQTEKSSLYSHINPWNATDQKHLPNPISQYNVWEFDQERILYKHMTEDIREISLTYELHNVFTNDLIPDSASPVKYDSHGKSIVIELYEEESETLVARIRLTEEEARQAEKLIAEFSHNYGSPGNASQQADYRALIYFNDMNFWFATDGSGVLYYCPDGDPTLCSVYGGIGNSLYYDMFHFSRFDKCAEYLNGILKDRLQ